MNKGVLAVVVVFFGFWLFKDPNGLAAFTSTSASSVWGWSQQFMTSLIQYIGKL